MLQYIVACKVCIIKRGCAYLVLNIRGLLAYLEIMRVPVNNFIAPSTIQRIYRRDYILIKDVMRNLPSSMLMSCHLFHDASRNSEIQKFSKENPKNKSSETFFHGMMSVLSFRFHFIMPEGNSFSEMCLIVFRSRKL